MPDESTPLLLVRPPLPPPSPPPSAPLLLTEAEDKAGRMVLGRFRRRSAVITVVPVGRRRRSSGGAASPSAAAASAVVSALGVGPPPPPPPPPSAAAATTSITIANYHAGADDDYDAAASADAHPAEGLAPLFPRWWGGGGIPAYADRARVPHREASAIKSLPPCAPHRRMARHRSFYLWWTNVSFSVFFLGRTPPPLSLFVACCHLPGDGTHNISKVLHPSCFVLSVYLFLPIIFLPPP